MSRVIKIKDVAVLNRETYKKNEFPDFINYLDTGSLTKNKVEGFQCLNTKEDKIPSRAQRKIKKHTILYSTVRPNQEHYGFFESNINDIVASTGFTTIDVVDDNINAKYLYYLLTQSHITEYLHAIGMNSVSSYPSISPNDIGDLKFKLPSLQTQKAIAKVLSDLDAKIELNNKINRELEAMAKTLYNYWFVQFDFPNEQGKPYKSSGGKMVYNEELKRKIPEGWEVKTLDKVEQNIITGKTPSTKIPENFGGNIPFITIGDVRGNMHIIETELTLSEKGANTQLNKFIPKGAICVTCIASPGLVGFATENSQTNQQLNSIVCEKRENKYYLYFYLTDYFSFSKAKTGNTFANMNKGDFSSIKVLSPQKELLIEFRNKLKSSIDNILVNSQQNQQLAELRDWLLPMLMNGQIKVGEAEEKLNMAAEP